MEGGGFVMPKLIYYKGNHYIGLLDSYLIQLINEHLQ